MNKPTIEERQASIHMQILRTNLNDAINNLALAFEREDAYKAQIADLEAKLNPKPTPEGTAGA